MGPPDLSPLNLQIRPPEGGFIYFGRLYSWIPFSTIHNTRSIIWYFREAWSFEYFTNPSSILSLENNLLSWKYRTTHEAPCLAAIWSLSLMAHFPRPSTAFMSIIIPSILPSGLIMPSGAFSDSKMTACPLSRRILTDIFSYSPFLIPKVPI